MGARQAVAREWSLLTSEIVRHGSRSPTSTFPGVWASLLGFYGLWNNHMTYMAVEESEKKMKNLHMYYVMCHHFKK